MAFGPGTESILLKLMHTPFTDDQVQIANEAGVAMEDVARVEFKLWIDYCEAIGEMSVNDGCIAEGRDRFYTNIVRFLAKRSTIPTALKRSQICTTRGAINAAERVGNVGTEISVADYEYGCERALDTLVKALKRMPEEERMGYLEVPVCQGALQQLMNN